MDVTTPDGLAEFFDISDVVGLIRGDGLIFLALVLLIFYIAKIAYGLLSPFDLREQLTSKDNKAVALSFGGYMLGVGIIMLGIIKSPAEMPKRIDPLVYDILSTVFWGLGGILLLLVARFINDRLLFAKFNNAKELVVDRNVGAGACECGSFVGSAILIYSAMQGTEGQLLANILGTILYFLLGQLGFWAYTAFYQLVVRYDLYGEIEQDNVAAGLSFGLNLIAVSFMLGGFISHSESVLGFLLWFIFVVLMMLSSRYLVDKFILPGALLDEEVCRDRNWGAALIEGGVALAVGFISAAIFFTTG